MTRIQLALALALGLFLTAALPAAAQNLEAFSGTVVGANLSAAGPATIEIRSFTTDEERQQVLAAYDQGGQQALYEHLESLKDAKAILRINNSLAYELHYVYKYRSADGFDNYVLATSRRLGFLSNLTNSRDRDQNVSLIIFAVDIETRKGKGGASAGVEFQKDKDGQLRLAHLGTVPAQITKIRQTQPKPEKKKKK